MQFKKHILSSEPYQGGTTRDEGNKKIIKLSSNENPLGPSPKAIAAIQAGIHMLHECDFQDDEKLRIALGEHYRIDRNHFICANSGLEVLDLIVRGFLEPGQECIISTPTFLAYKNFSEKQGAIVIDVPLDSIDFSLDAGKILSAVNEKTRIVFLASPNNLTGSVIKKKAMEKIIRGLPRHVVLVYDEVYGHFTRHKEFLEGTEYVKDDVPLIAINSFSKAHGLAGLRIGYAYSTMKIAEYLNHLRWPFMISSPATLGAIAALKDINHILATQKTIRNEKQWLYDQRDDLGINHWPCEGNFILFISPYNNLEFGKDMLEKSIMVRTTDPFGLPGCIRLSVGNHDANVACMKALGELMTKKAES
jgi:histidinol-phosphate aminotransferase